MAQALQSDTTMLGVHLLEQQRTASHMAEDPLALEWLLDDLYWTLVEANWEAERVQFRGRPAVAIRRSGMTIHVVRESYGTVALWREGTVVTPPEIAGIKSDPWSGWMVTPEGKDALLELAAAVIKAFSA